MVPRGAIAELPVVVRTGGTEARGCTEEYAELVARAEGLALQGERCANKGDRDRKKKIPCSMHDSDMTMDSGGTVLGRCGSDFFQPSTGCRSMDLGVYL